MSANGARNRVVITGARIEAVYPNRTAEDYTGQPDLPCVNIGEPQRAEGAPRTRHLKHLFESYAGNTGEPARDGKEGGE